MPIGPQKRDENNDEGAGKSEQMKKTDKTNKTNQKRKTSKTKLDAPYALFAYQARLTDQGLEDEQTSSIRDLQGTPTQADSNAAAGV